MAWIEDVFTSPVKDSIHPEILIKVEFNLDSNNEALAEFSGVITDTTGIRLAALNNWSMPHNHQLNIGLGLNHSSNHRSLILDFYFQLTQKSLGYIESIRDSNSQKNVKLKVLLNTTSFKSQMQNPNILITSDSQKGLPYPGTLINPLDISYPGNAHGINLVVANQNMDLLEVRYEEHSRLITISSSDWAQKYCPVLGVGKFASVDLYIPESEKAESELENFLNDAIHALEEMKSHIYKGEWRSVIKESRQLAELLRNKKNKKEWNQILTHIGYTEETIQHLNGLIQNLFDYSSKFIHRVDKKNDLLPKVSVEKEDAYFVYSSAIGLVNLLSRKLKIFQDDI